MGWRGIITSAESTSLVRASGGPPPPKKKKISGLQVPLTQYSKTPESVSSVQEKMIRAPFFKRELCKKTLQTSGRGH